MISIVLPTYNERENINLVVDKIADALTPLKHPFEVIIADDNSPDETWLAARELAQTRPWLRVLRRLSDPGLGPAVMDGFRAAQGDWMVVMDADMQHDETVLPRFIELFASGADLVIGTRHGSGGSVGEWNRARRFISFSATLVARLSLKKTTTDPMSGFFGVSRRFFCSVKNDINARGFKILLEFLARCGSANRVAEVGYSFRLRQHGNSKLSSRVIVDYLVSLYSLSPLGHFVPLRMFRYGLVGLSGVLVNFISSLLLLKAFQQTPRTSVWGAIGIAIFSNYVLNNIFTFTEQKKRTLPTFVWGLLTYYVICSVGAFVQYSVYFTLNKELNFGFSQSNLIGIGVATFWNFMLSANMIWKAKT